ncbi:hypothetical protein RchiOBHm_Chr6g0300961 [Rosa chinensis]|uniref:Uncharacterized protein n=1 Tax=Rosa chinensis TaxID=74649 RepID=A0A2P6PYK9_ROSCH|nr:hypothetical protein RchiOBHm_Chr6g0300961 [Rosa chinensis]
MAKRSDFAQKLLDDLRVRKERMAAPAQSSNRSNAMAIGPMKAQNSTLELTSAEVKRLCMIYS